MNEYSGANMTPQQILNQSLGQTGFDVETGSGTPPTGVVWVALLVDQDANFSAVQEDVNGKTMDDLPSGDRSQGFVIYGRFTSITVTSGTVLCYRDKQ